MTSELILDFQSGSNAGESGQSLGGRVSLSDAGESRLSDAGGGTRLSFFPPVPDLIDDEAAAEDDFAAILKTMEMLETEISEALEK